MNQYVRDRMLAATAFVTILAVGAVLFGLVDSARTSAVHALEESLTAEVSAIARSQDQRLSASLSGSAGLAAQQWEFTEGSQADLDRLEDLLQFIPDLETGFYLLDTSQRVTQGVLLKEPLGTVYDRIGLADLIASDQFAAGVGGVLPVDAGLTTEQPNIAYLFPVLDNADGRLRGAFVFESEVGVDSSLNVEIAELRRGETGTYIFADSGGTVIAANDDALIGRPLETRLLDLDDGLASDGSSIVVAAPVPSAGWQIVFTQDRAEFEQNLSQPLATAGQLIVVVFLLVGGIVVLMLLRRLAAAREEQERLRLLHEKQEEFLSIVSHELRTPVSGVLGFLQTTLDHWPQMSDDDRREAVRRAATNGRRLQALTRDVLDAQSLESGSLSYHFAPVDLRDEVQVAVEAAGSLFGDRVIDLTVPEHDVVISADADRMQQVFTNLLDNAHKNSPVNEPLRVALELAGGRIRITVTDRGAGIVAEDAERIFEKFVRGRGSTVSGTGLGLYVARQIVEAHEGTLSVKSVPGSGTTFTIDLPASDQSG